LTRDPAQIEKKHSLSKGVHIAVIGTKEPLVEPNRDGVAKGKERGYLLSEDGPPFWLRKERNRGEFTS
jgi:hypothetical protein